MMRVPTNAPSNPTRFIGLPVFKVSKLYPLKDSDDKKALEAALFDIEYPGYIAAITRRAYSDTAKNIKKNTLEGGRKLRKRLATLPAQELRDLLRIELELLDWWSPGKVPADIDYWSKMEYWTPEQAALIAKDIEPRKIELKKALEYAKWVPEVQKLKELWEILQSSLLMRKLTKFSPPAEYMEWFLEKGFINQAKYKDGENPSKPKPENLPLYKKEKQTRKTEWHGAITSWRAENNFPDKPNIYNLYNHLKSLPEDHLLIHEYDAETDGFYVKGKTTPVKKGTLGNVLLDEWKKLHD